MKHLPLAAALAVLPALAWGQTYPFPNAPYAGEKGTGAPSTSDQILVQQGVTSHDPVGSPARMTLGTLQSLIGTAFTGGNIANPITVPGVTNSGNETVAGTLGVTGAATLTGGFTVPSAASATFNNTPVLANGALVSNSKTITFQSGSTLQVNASAGVSSTLTAAGNLFYGNFTFSGSSLPALGQSVTLAAKTVASGALTNSGDVNFYPLQVNADSLAMSGGGGANAVWINDQLGATFSGSRRGLSIDLAPTSANTQIAPGTTLFLTGIRTNTVANFSLGGTAGNNVGDLYGYNPNVFANAPYINSVNAIEAGVGLESGAIGAKRLVGYSLILDARNVIHGATDDAAWMVGQDYTSNWNSGSLGFLNLMQIGRTGLMWPLDPGGSIITTHPDPSPNPAFYQVRPQVAAYDIDFSKVNCTQAAFWSPGVKLGCDGTISVGAIQIAPSATGATIDGVGYSAASPTISVAGASYAANDQLYDTQGGILLVDTVNGSGNVTAWHYLRTPYYYGATPPATMTLSGGTGNQQAVVGVTWTQEKQLSLNPSGGPIVMASLPTSCTSKPTGTVWNNSGVLNVCP